MKKEKIKKPLALLLTGSIIAGMVPIHEVEVMAASERYAFTKIVSGANHTLALKRDGTVYGWGDNSSYQLGQYGGFKPSSPVQLEGVSNIIDIQAGRSFSIFLKSDGTVWAWGGNSDGQLGNGETSRSGSLVQVSGLTNVKQIFSGRYSSFAIKHDGTVWAWGDNSAGQLGDGTNIDRLTPVKISGLTNIKDIKVGASNALALTNSGTVLRWGNNAYGSTPSVISGLSGVVNIEAGEESCFVVKSDGTVWGWGRNAEGQLGDGTTEYKSSPSAVTGLTGFKSIKSGRWHTLGVKSDGTVWAWGDNTNGQIGDGTLNRRLTPVKINSLINTIEIQVGEFHSVAIQGDGTVRTWGDNYYAQLGDGTTTTDKLTPNLNQNLLFMTQECINMFNEATLALNTAKATISKVDVNLAGSLINALPNSDDKSVLLNRLAPIQSLLTGIEELESKIAITENTLSKSDMNAMNNAFYAIWGDLADLAPELEVSLKEKIYRAEAIVDINEVLVTAENSKSQTDLDIAKTTFNKYANNYGYGSYIEAKAPGLITRLNALQDYIDNNLPLIKATESVTKAEASKLQVDLDEARVLVNALSNGTDKTALTTRLDNLQKYISQKKIEDLLNRIEEILNSGNVTEEDMTEIDGIWGEIEETVNQMPDSAEKEDISNQVAITEATAAVVKAEGSKTQVDVNAASTLVNALPAGTDKTALTTRLNTVQAEVDAIKALQTATAAVVKAEGSKTQVDVNSAKTLINALPAGIDKTNLTNRINLVQAEIDANNNQQQALINATAAVVKAEGSKLQTDVDSARILVSSLNTGTEKTVLETRLNAIQNEINALKALQNAVNAVVKAESSKLQSDVNSARTLVNALPSGTDKTALTGRLDIVQAEIDKTLEGGGETPTVNSPEAIADAEKKLKLADAYKRDPYITNAEESVNALVDSTEKAALLNRLEALRESVIQETFEKALKSAENKVIMAEKYNREAYTNSAREAVNALPDCPEKEALDTRLDNIGQAGGEDGSGTGDGTQTVSSARVIKAAVTALTRAETSPTRYNILYAERKVNLVTDTTPEKTELKARLAVLQGTYDSQLAEQNATKALASADRYVTLAERYKNTFYFTKAETMVKALVDSSGKTALLARIEVLRPVVYPSPEQVLISTATKAVEKAEQYPNNSLYLNRAAKAVDVLPEGEIKTALLERLSALTNPVTPEIPQV